MALTKARAIVLKTIDVGESNKRLTLFAKNIGKLTVSAKGAKNVKSKFHSCAQQFSYCDYLLYNGNGFTSVAEASIIMNFSSFYKSIESIAFGSYFLELTDKTVMPAQQSDEILLLLLKSLNFLKTLEPKKTSVVFQIKLLDLLGFRLTPEMCAVCGNKIDKAFFSSNLGFVCEKDLDEGFFVSDSAKKAIKYISEAENSFEGYNKIFMFTSADSLIDSLHNIAEKILKYQLDIKSNSLTLIERTF